MQVASFTTYPTIKQYEVAVTSLLQKFPVLEKKTTKDFWKSKLRNRFANERRRHLQEQEAVRKRKLSAEALMKRKVKGSLSRERTTSPPGSSVSPTSTLTRCQARALSGKLRDFDEELPHSPATKSAASQPGSPACPASPSRRTLAKAVTDKAGQSDDELKRSPTRKSQPGSSACPTSPVTRSQTKAPPFKNTDSDEELDTHSK